MTLSHTNYTLDRLPVFIFRAGNELDALSLLEVSFYPRTRCLQQAERFSGLTPFCSAYIANCAFLSVQSVSYYHQKGTENCAYSFCSFVKGKNVSLGSDTRFIDFRILSYSGNRQTLRYTLQHNTSS